MGEKRVTQQEASDEIYNDDWFLKDSILHDTTKVQPSVIKEYVNQGMATSQDLTDTIETEATARANADTALGGRIDDEATARQQADTALGQRIDNLNFSADAISYDNTSSGLEADNVQDAIGETITKLSAVGSASGDIATFPDGSDLSMPKLEVAIEPQQDLHGYDAPWVGGAGKNKFDGTATLDNKWINAQGEVESQYGFWTSDYIPVKQGDVIRRTSTGSGRGALYDTNKENAVYSSGTEVTATQSGYYRFCGDKSIILPTGNVVCTINNTDLTFAPYSNICPISGWDEVNVGVVGKNLFDKTATDTNKGYISGKWINQTGNTFSYGDWSVSEYIRVDGEKIAVSGMTVAEQVSSGRGGYCCYDKYKNVLGGGTYNALTQIITLPTNTEYIRISVWNQNKDVCQLELGTTPTTYEPYNGQTITIDLDGTRYGGTLDVVSGVLTVDRVSVDLGTLNWTYSSETNRERFSAQLSGVKWVSDSIPINAICSALFVTDFYTVYNHITDNTIGMWHGTTLAVNSSAYTDVATFKTAMSGVQLVYELATPLTIQLTPTVVKSLRGLNNVYADSGAILDAEYIRDLTAIINYILSLLENQ